MEYIAPEIKKSEESVAMLPESGEKQTQESVTKSQLQIDMDNLNLTDEVVNSLAGSILETESWNINGNYSWPKTPNLYKDLITKLND